MSKTSAQLSLFETPAGNTPVPDVAPAPVAAPLAGLATRLPPGLYLGTSSWYFPGWAGIVYNKKIGEQALRRNGLRAYAAHTLLNCVGIDRTFYAPLAAHEYARYATQVPAGFRFLVKAPILITSPVVRDENGQPTARNPHFLDPDFANKEFIAPCREGLGAKAGPLVFQFSPLGGKYAHDPARFAALLHDFLAALPAGPLYAVEIRDTELLTGDYARVLREIGARHCFGVHPRMPDIAAQARVLGPALKGPLVARWSLHSDFRYEQAKARYAPFDKLIDEDPATRGALAALCCSTLAAGESAFVIANNKAEGSAPLTCVKLAEAISSEWRTDPPAQS